MDRTPKAFCARPIATKLLPTDTGWKCMMMSRTHLKLGHVILDADDTLWRTQDMYDEAKTAFAKLLGQNGFVSNNVVDTLDEIDAKRVATHGFSVSRFKESLVITYEMLCEREGLPNDSKVVSSIESIGDSVTKNPALYEDVNEGIRVLSRHYSLVLATKGDTSLQNARLDSSGLRPWFFRIYNLQSKTEREYREIIRDLAITPEKTWVVGNSVRSDINPASRLGLRSVLIPRGSWIYEDERLEQGQVITVHSFKEAVNAILAADHLHGD